MKIIKRFITWLKSLFAKQNIQPKIKEQPRKLTKRQIMSKIFWKRRYNKAMKNERKQYALTKGFSIR